MPPAPNPTLRPTGHAIQTSQRPSKKRLVGIIGLGMVIVAVIASIIFSSWLSYSILTPLGSGQSQIITIPEKSGVSDIAQLLEDKGLIRSRLAFEIYVRFGPARSLLKPGPYQLKSSMSTVQIVDYLTAGKIAVRTFVARDGLTLKQLADSYQQQGFGTSAELSEAIKQAVLPSEIQTVFGKRQSLEGFLLADSYNLVINEPASALVKRMLDNFQAKALPLFKVAKTPNNLTPYQVLTISSIVEKEASKSDDRAMIAEVFYNRLRLGIKLESDVTVIYITGRIDPTAADLNIDSPYNTRKNPGIPPTPINSPSL
nr:endolytic transglycosylase MltG [Candidatus Saccharibacteria bacterium]